MPLDADKGCGEVNHAQHGSELPRVIEPRLLGGNLVREHAELAGNRGRDL